MWDLRLHQRGWAVRAAGILCAALSLQSCASAGDGASGGIEAAKARQRVPWPMRAAPIKTEVAGKPETWKLGFLMATSSGTSSASIT